MTNSQSKHYDEIDLFKIFQTIWKKKLVIIYFAISFFIFSFAFQTISPNTSFTSITLIKSITSTEIEKYRLYNSNIDVIEDLYSIGEEPISFKQNIDPSRKLFKIDSKLLFNLFLEKLNERDIFDNTIKKFNLIDKNKYDKDYKYDEAVMKLSSKLKIILAAEELKLEEDSLEAYLLKFEFNDIGIWKKALQYLAEEVNEQVRLHIIKRFEQTLFLANEFKTKKISDLNFKIENELFIYDTETRKKLAYLQEQASIARELNIEIGKNDQFIVQNNVKTETVFPLYTRGYKPLEEEIRQLNNRKDRKIFVSKIRDYEKKIRLLKSDDSIKLIDNSFNATPIKSDKFKSVILKLPSTKFIMHNKFTLYLLLSTFLGGLTGIFYVLIRQTYTEKRS